MLRTIGVIAFWTLAWAETSGWAVNHAGAQEVRENLTTPDWGDYPMLMSQFGELCTMCEAYVRCSYNPSEAASGPPYNLYYFQTKSFWGQIATIWDYFAVWFSPVTSENRPATIYRFTKESGPNIAIQTTAYLSEADTRIDIDGTWINRDTADWFSAAGVPIGSCNRLGIPESMALIAAHGDWTEKLEGEVQ